MPADLLTWRPKPLVKPLEPTPHQVEVGRMLEEIRERKAVAQREVNRLQEREDQLADVLFDLAMYRGRQRLENSRKPPESTGGETGGGRS